MRRVFQQLSLHVQSVLVVPDNDKMCTNQRDNDRRNIFSGRCCHFRIQQFLKTITVLLLQLKAKILF